MWKCVAAKALPSFSCICCSFGWRSCICRCLRLMLVQQSLKGWWTTGKWKIGWANLWFATSEPSLTNKNWAASWTSQRTEHSSASPWDPRICWSCCIWRSCCSWERCSCMRPRTNRLSIYLAQFLQPGWDLKILISCTFPASLHLFIAWQRKLLLFPLSLSHLTSRGNGYGMIWRTTWATLQTPSLSRSFSLSVVFSCSRSLYLCT